MSVTDNLRRTLQNKALKNYYEKAGLSEEKKLEVREAFLPVLKDENSNIRNGSCHTCSQVVEFVAKVVNPLIIVAFVVIYWVVGLIFYHNPSY